MFTGLLSNVTSGQDCVKILPDGAVLADGHGVCGKYYAEEVCKKIEMLHKSGREDVSEWSTEIENEMIASWAVKDPGVTIIDDVPINAGKVVRGGTTLTYVSFNRDRRTFTVANAGDSRGYIFGKGYINLITADHSPLSRSEYERIESLRTTNDRIGTLMYNTSVGEMIPIYNNGEKINYFPEYNSMMEATKAWHQATASLKLDPDNQDKKTIQTKCLAVYHETLKIYQRSNNYANHSRMMIGTAKGEYGTYIVSNPKYEKYGETTLSCTCTIGDHHAKKIGVRSNWDMSQINIDDIPGIPGERVIFVASDGVHDSYTEEDLADLVLHTESDEELLQKFIANSKNMFSSNKQHDDISFFRARF
uniref:PPM-type phosphatase domain-containing protein n=1 Tax=viral metagenome TaxID=1070528 RepID=A0A6C0KF93_9ZZZZ